MLSEAFGMRQQIKHRISILVGLALIGLSVNGYAAEVSADKTPTTAASSETNGVSEIHTINVTANRMALLDLDTPAAMDVITQKDLANSCLLYTSNSRDCCKRTSTGIYCTCL